VAVAKILSYTGVDDGLPRIRLEQEMAIRRMISEPTKSICNASNMDTGKTLQAVEFVVRLNLKRVLYVGVKDTFAQWADRLAAQSEFSMTLLRMDSTKQGRVNFALFLAGGKGHYFVGAQWLTSQDWETVSVFSDADGTDGPVRQVDTDGRPRNRRIHLKRYSQMTPIDAIIYDEVHVVANRKSIGRRTLMSVKSEWKIAMSGTWMGNKFENAWGITRWLWPDVIEPNFYTWRRLSCETEFTAVGDGHLTDRVIGERREGAFTASLPCYIRIDGELEVPAPELLFVDLLPEQWQMYRDLEEHLLTWLRTSAGRLAALVVDMPVVLRTRLRTATLGTMAYDDDGEIFFPDDTRSTKWFALESVLTRPAWQKESVGIYTDSRLFARVVVKRMRAAGHNAVEWSGDVNSARREDIKRRFLDGEIQYLVSTIQSFSTGLDGFQTICNKVIWLSESDNNMLNNQAIKRYYRSGRAEGFEHVKILARETYDVGVFGQNIRETLAMNASMKATD